MLNRIIARDVVAQTPADAFPPAIRAQIRDALLDEEWGKAAELWMTHYSGEHLDVYPSGLTVWTDAMITADMAPLELQFTPLFRDLRGDAPP